jgi:hypothetical protein
MGLLAGTTPGVSAVTALVRLHDSLTVAATEPPCVKTRRLSLTESLEQLTGLPGGDTSVDAARLEARATC